MNSIFSRISAVLVLASTLTVLPASAALPTNTTNDGATINAGTYANTNGAETKFINSAGTGITLNAGQNIRGVEVTGAGAYTGNGGAIHIQAPDQVVRLNGNIDVRDFLPNGGKHTGTLTIYGPDNDSNPITHGGNVTVDAAYLFQNGNIYASGLNGGDVQFNVGGMTMGPTSRIDASGQNFISQSFREASGAGGNVNLNSTGDVDINKGAFITTNGNNSGYDGSLTFFGNNIVIVGRGVNIDGTLYAGQLLNRDWAIWATENGHIHISATDPSKDVTIGKDAILQTDGGPIKIDSQRDINQNGLVLASGNSAFNGTSDDDPYSPGTQGGKGGSISLTAANAVNNTGRIQADGHGSDGGEGHGGVGEGFHGGDGGVIIVTAPNVNNSGVIRAMGGNTSLFNANQPPETLGAGGKGGSVEFIGANPSGTGIVATFGGQGSTPGALGTITAPDPAASTNTLYGVWKKN